MTTMARFLFLLHPDGANLGGLSDADKAALLSKFIDWSASLRNRGCLVGVERLRMGDAGQTVRKRRDAIVVDGPYAEARECVSGLFIVEADGYADASRLAGECPLVHLGGAVEVREIDPSFPSR
jgi:hypothetical protein